MTTLLVETPTTAIALIVSLQRMVSGPVYKVLPVEGELPSRVKRISPSKGIAIAT
ncbi:MAG: hypothetical protein U0105_22575 [Candidatus Obscuribacterales bacterium]